ncbi:MAG TPA: PDDEXK nuclease domain-containing protein [Bacteroidales bacterium]|jgi:predicted nuclease of restriction endonuclease-like (RecB) superfamily|nr:PDDEXK nuclease domain-containing protein [Bacteroidales bacterium]
MKEIEKQPPELYSDVCRIIENTRTRLATTANAEVCLMNWQVGLRIKTEILKDQRAEYGKEVIKNLAKLLTEKYGKGWSLYKLQHCVRSAYVFAEDEIMYAVRTQLTWTHLRSLMSINDELKRRFYMEMVRIEHWDTRTLDEKIDGMFYERTILSRKPEEFIKQELQQIQTTHTLTPDVVFRSSYFLDTLGLADTYSEKDLEDAILINLQSFIKEMGSDFAFLDRQKRITIDAVDYRIDLLFFHRGLKRLVAIDLKLGKFKPEHEGQMLLYLRYLNKNERKEGEGSPIGLILCSEGNTEHIEYLMLEESNIKVAQYYTQLPDKKILSEKLHKAIAIAREAKQSK